MLMFISVTSVGHYTPFLSVFRKVMNYTFNRTFLGVYFKKGKRFNVVNVDCILTIF